MTNGKRRDARKEHQGRQSIEDRRSSRLSVRAFCARHRLSQASFYAWRWELQRRDTERPAFVPVRAVGTDRPPQDRGVEVVLCGGRTVRVAPGFDATTLQ